LIKKAIDSYFKQTFGGVSYITFMVTGIVVMTAFMGSFISGISVIWDKQFGFSQRNPCSTSNNHYQQCNK